MSFRRRLLTGMAWMFAGSWSEQAISFAVFIVLARLLGTEAFGLATMAIVFVLFAEFLVRQTLTETIIQLKNLENGHLDAIFWLLGFLSILLVTILILSAEHIAQIFSEPRIANYLIWATPTILITGFSGVPVSLLKREFKFRALAIRATLGVLVGGIAGIVLAIQGFGVWSFIAQRVVQISVDYSLVWIAHPWKPKFRAKRRHFRDVIGFSSQVIGIRLSELISVNTPVVVIGVFFGPAMLGQYAIGWRLVEVLSTLITLPIQFVAQPAFAHLDRSKAKVGDLLTNIISTSGLITFASFFGMATVSAPTINFFFGANWVEAIPIHQVLCLLGIYLSIERLQQVFCLALGYAKALFYLSLAEALVGIVAILAFVDYGVLGVTAAFTARYYLMWPIRFIIVARIADTKSFVYVKAFAMPLINAIIMTIVIISWQHLVAPSVSTLTLLTSSILIGVLIYYLGVRITMNKRVQELLLFIQSIKRTNNKKTS